MTAPLLRTNPHGWTFAGIFTDPPHPPPGFATETREDGLLGIVTHYRFSPAREEKGGPDPAHMSTVDVTALCRIEGSAPCDGWLEAFPPHSRTMEEWCKASAEEDFDR